MASMMLPTPLSITPSDQQGHMLQRPVTQPNVVGQRNIHAEVGRTIMVRGRVLGNEFATPYHDRRADFSMDIPLTYHIGLSTGTLQQAALWIRGRYGERSWQHHAGHGVHAKVDSRPEQAPPFDSDGTLTVRGYCTWLFQISKLQLELSKLLSCSEPDEHWQLDPDFVKRRSVGAVLGRDELAGKTVRLDLRVNPEEEPSMYRRWIQTEKGWKPCQGTESSERTWMWCRNPPTFRTFSM